MHSELLVAADDPLAVVARLADPGTRIATLTVTEQGYTARAGSGRLDTDIAVVRADLAGAPSRTTIGLLARGLQARWRGHGAPMAIVSCDNIARNGEHTRALVLEFVGLLAEPDAAPLGTWIERSIGFACTNGRPDRAGHAARASRPRRRAARPVRRRAARRRAVLHVGARGPLSPRAAALRGRRRDLQRRGRALRAAQAAPAQRDPLADRLPRAARRRAVDRAGDRPPRDPPRRRARHRDELRPTLDAPAQVDVAGYVEALFARFANADVDHRTRQVASDGSAKLPVRITDAVLHHVARGVVPRLLALTVAAYIRCLATPEAYDAGRLGAIADPERERLEERGRRARDSGELVRAVFELGIFAPTVAGATAFVDAVAELHAVLVAHDHHGVRRAWKAAATCGSVVGSGVCRVVPKLGVSSRSQLHLALPRG